MIGLMMMLAAAPVSPQSLIFGMGSVSCATAWESVNERASAEWALGFWSGRNVERGALIGQQTDRAGVLAEIQLECSKAPSTILITATIAVYTRLEKTKR